MDTGASPRWFESITSQTPYGLGFVRVVLLRWPARTVAMEPSAIASFSFESDSSEATGSTESLVDVNGGSEHLRVVLV